jgi:hypothetical protein
MQIFLNVSVFPGDFEFSGIVCNQLSLGIVKYILFRSFQYLADFFEGASTFLIPKLGWVKICLGPLEKPREMPHYMFCPRKKINFLDFLNQRYINSYFICVFNYDNMFTCVRVYVKHAYMYACLLYNIHAMHDKLHIC